jgi:hypothetical protein
VDCKPGFLIGAARSSKSNSAAEYVRSLFILISSPIVVLPRFRGCC